MRIIVVFIQSGESIYDPPQFGFFYDIYDAINKHNQRKTNYFSLIPNYFDMYFSVNQNESYL